MTRDVVKLAPGTYADNAYFQTDLAVSLYGPGAVLDMGYSGSGSFKVRDVDATGFGCGPPNSTRPHPTVDVRRMTMAYDQATFGAGLCNLTAHQLRITSGFSSTPIGVRGAGGAGGSTLVLEDSVIDGGFAAMAVTDFSSATVINTVFKNQSGNAITYMSSIGASTISFSTFYNSVWTCPAGNNVWTSSNNIFLDEKSGAPADTVSGTQCTHSYDLIKPQSTTLSGANNIVNQDPRFVNGASGDFHLIVGSPAIDAANPAATNAVDFDGTARPQGAGRDLGAFEYKP